MGSTIKFRSLSIPDHTVIGRNPEVRRRTRTAASRRSKCWQWWSVTCWTQLCDGLTIDLGMVRMRNGFLKQYNSGTVISYLYSDMFVICTRPGQLGGYRPGNTGWEQLMIGKNFFLQDTKYLVGCSHDLTYLFCPGLITCLYLLVT